MFTTIKAKEILYNQDEILTSNLFIYVEKNWEEKIISSINNKSLRVWEIKDEDGLTILHKSCFLNNTSLSLTIIRETRKRLGYTPIFTSFINAKTEEGLTALHYTAYKGNIELSKNLIQNGGDVIAVTNLGKNIIHLSAEGNQPSFMVFYLYKRVIDVSTQDHNKSTPLHWACYAGASDSVKFLLGLEAEINASDKNELTPLHLAALHGRKDIVIKLLQSGAIKDMKNTRGETPLVLAWKKKYKDIYDILNRKEFHPLLSIEEPLIYIEPKDTYRKIIIFCFIFQELFIIFSILPYLKDFADIILNNVIFVLDILFLIILLKKEPGYKKNDFQNQKDNIASLHGFPWVPLIEKNIDIRYYCPKCYVPVLHGIKHCIICQKCVEGFSHHCFWINKCIGKKNILIYFLFICMTLIYALDSIYICLLSLFEFDYLPYEKFIYRSIIKSLKERQIRVFFSALIGIFSAFIIVPFFYLFFHEIVKYLSKFKCCKGVKNKKKRKSDFINKNLELETKSLILEDDDDDLSINASNFGEDREANNIEKKGTNLEDSDIISQGSKNIITIPQTPNLSVFKEKNNVLFEDYSDE